MVGERGHILISDDDGASWTQAKVPTRVLLTAVHMHDERTGWAVGHDAVILRTGDGGETWTMVHQAPDEELPLLDVWFRDERTGFAVGGLRLLPRHRGRRGDVGRADHQRRRLPPERAGARGGAEFRIAARPVATTVHCSGSGGRLPLRRRREDLARAALPLRRLLVRRTRA